MTKEIRALINRTNAQKSTGPRTSAGRQRSAMNAVKHNLTGSRLILQPDEMEAYNHLSSALVSELKPMTELERQTVQKRKGRRLRFARFMKRPSTRISGSTASPASRTKSSTSASSTTPPTRLTTTASKS
jgi:hypothetical protein